MASFFNVTDAERTDLMSLLAAARDDLDREFRPAGYNIGINDGAAAGQTVPHLHIHLIPRYEGDRDDPRGGVRWVDFVSDHESDLLQLGTDAGLLVDRATSVAVAEWSYGHAERVQAEVWLGGKEYGHLSANWRRLLL